jgi:hypothetical protein
MAVSVVVMSANENTERSMKAPFAVVGRMRGTLDDLVCQLHEAFHSGAAPPSEICRQFS